MKYLTLIVLILISLFSTGCSSNQAKEVNKQVKNIDQKASFAKQINVSLKKGVDIKEVKNPNLKFPSDIHAKQVQTYFKIGNILLATVLNRSMNIDLQLPHNIKLPFTGVLVANQGDNEWSKLVEIKNINSRNNPYYITIKNNKLLLTVVDSTGAGSGEGIMKVFSLVEGSNWNLEDCYYFAEESGGSFADTVNFSKHKKEPLSKCKNVQLISRQSSL